MKRYSHRFLCAVLVSGLLVSACASKSIPPPVLTPSQVPTTAAPLGEWEKVLASASKEGTITVYSTWGAQTGEAMRVGMSKYGIKVETIGGTGGELEMRIGTEQRAKAYTADLFTGGWSNQVNVVKAGYGQSVNVALPALAEKDVWKLRPDKYLSTYNVYAPGTSLTPSLIINTDLVSKGDVQSWQDLLDPKWRDKIVMTDPRSTGGGPGNAGLAVWMTKLSEDFWRKLGSQRVSMQVKYDVPVSQVALGEKHVAVFPAYSSTLAAIKAGAPIRIVHFKEGTPYYFNGIAFVKNAPHPNAALVLLNWYFTREGQIALCRALSNYSIRNDIVEDWLGIPELNAATFTLLEPPTSFLSDQDRQNAAELANRAFGAR